MSVDKRQNPIAQNAKANMGLTSLFIPAPKLMQTNATATTKPDGEAKYYTTNVSRENRESKSTKYEV